MPGLEAAGAHGLLRPRAEARRESRGASADIRRSAARMPALIGLIARDMDPALCRATRDRADNSVHGREKARARPAAGPGFHGCPIRADMRLRADLSDLSPALFRRRRSRSLQASSFCRPRARPPSGEVARRTCRLADAGCKSASTAARCSRAEFRRGDEGLFAGIGRPRRWPERIRRIARGRGAARKQVPAQESLPKARAPLRHCPNASPLP